jgi:broad specificity phosphatase PhoE
MTTENKIIEHNESFMPRYDDGSTIPGHDDESTMPDLVSINDTDDQTNSNMIFYFVRHENRFLHGLADCSLTNEGIFSAKNELPEKFNMILSDNTIKINNIYCSPLLRTIQTIYPTAKLLGKQIKLEQSLYELVNSWTSHYTAFVDCNKNLPMIDHNCKSTIPLYFLQATHLLKIKYKLDKLSKDISLSKTWNEWIVRDDSQENIQKYNNILLELKSDLDVFLVMMNDDRYTYATKNIRKYIHDDPNISSVIQNIANCIIFIEAIIVCKIPISSTLIEIVKNLSLIDGCLLFVNESLKLMGSYNMSEILDTDYHSIINLSNFIKGKEKESYTDSIERSQPIVHNMFNLPEYQDSVYVSHQSTINAMFVSVFKTMFRTKDDALAKLNTVFNSINSSDQVFESFEDFCENNHITAGGLYKVTINTIKNNILVEKY